MTPFFFFFFNLLVIKLASIDSSPTRTLWDQPEFSIHLFSIVVAIQGDRNTVFYHVFTLVRRKRNQILAIKNLVREWLYGEDAIKNVIWSGFNEVYSSSLSSAS